jgi:hypothetical protein
VHDRVAPLTEGLHEDLGVAAPIDGQLVRPIRIADHDVRHRERSLSTQGRQGQERPLIVVQRVADILDEPAVDRDQLGTSRMYALSEL